VRHSTTTLKFGIAAHLKTQETKGNANGRKAWKLTLVKRLYELGYSRSDILNLFKFIDWVMILPRGLEPMFWKELATYEEENRMPYVTSVERIGIKKGIEQGIEQATRTIALNFLRQGTAIEAIAQATGLTVAQLQALQAENQ
jgi:predicted DNA-binding ribbon-helix-helix protein